MVRIPLSIIIYRVYNKLVEGRIEKIDDKCMEKGSFGVWKLRAYMNN